MNILFTDATVLPMTAAAGEPQTFTGSLGISGNRIEFVSASAADAEAFRAAHPDARTIDCRGKLLMPGLINTHCHAAMTLQRSYADDIALMEWLNDYIWPFEARQTPDDVALGMTLGIVEMLLGGVTSFVDMYYFEDRGVEVVRRTGIRAVLGCNYFDTNVEEVFPQMERALELAAGCDRIRIAAAPHAPYTVSPENM
ncbi:MAG: amidohydrolase family protein, partial [Alistipes sp.]|nr:amidohydrolase family protein [Alistipes sp.]